MALKAAAAITWRSLLANFLIVLAAIVVSLASGLNVGVRPTGATGLAVEWSGAFGAYVGIAQAIATVWAVKRAVEVTLPIQQLPVPSAVRATWSFAWRHFVAVFGVATLLYYPARNREDGVHTFALTVLALWTFGPSFLWAVRNMLRSTWRKTL